MSPFDCAFADFLSGNHLDATPNPSANQDDEEENDETLEILDQEGDEKDDEDDEADGFVLQRIPCPSLKSHQLKVRGPPSSSPTKVRAKHLLLKATFRCCA
ncbi:hypothetical protein L6452_01829 [Arctium lappa]|uniref:Uncharacterized protein n=1 Tax=Arctium lappa TaxID=4217 RepID=A0ACB9FIR5_ARCLA|nr:hypothetical protein L6452_01829 [Arctium lappa]